MSNYKKICKINNNSLLNGAMLSYSRSLPINKKVPWSRDFSLKRSLFYFW